MLKHRESEYAMHVNRLVINSKIAEAAIPVIVDRLKTKNVEIRGDETAQSIDDRIVAASERTGDVSI